jgi:hypothetical protein
MKRLVRHPEGSTHGDTQTVYLVLEGEPSERCRMFPGLKRIKVGIETREVRDTEEALAAQWALAKEEKP